ncbi:unnamed protein product [Rotaria sordida]|uniref:Uncharacterized protein n=2 Tax=Rotaria sordida TaxID=392033 RepID=A0A814FGU7_9BILA|nr:unnamed protein product [Rotaria sordida]
MKVDPNDRESIAEAHRCIAEVHQWMDNAELAFYHADEAKRHLSDDTLEMARIYSIKANIICRNSKLPFDALDYYRKVLAIRLCFLPEDHPDLGITYNNMGAVHSDIGEYELALEAFLHSLDIKRKALSPGHHSIQETETNIHVIEEMLVIDEDTSDDD